MKYLVVGAGNASRPVARLLNYLGHDVVITDLKDISEFKIEFQRSLIEMEKEGVKLDLPNKDPSVDGFDAVYVPPTLPETAPIALKIRGSDLKVLTNEEFSKTVNDLIPVDIIGITGTMGKTTTTYITTSLFKQAGYNVWSCSSLVNNLVSEAIIDGIVKGRAQDCDIAIFELPHGTIGLLNKLNVKIGLLTNIAEDHLSEFGGSLELYQQRKMILEAMSETFIANYSCYDIINPKRSDALYYALDEDVDFDELARATEGYVASDIELIVNKAALEASRNDELISQEVLMKRVSITRRSVSDKDRAFYDEMNRQMQSLPKKEERKKIGFVTGY